MSEFLFYLKWWVYLGLPGFLFLVRKHIKIEGFITIGDIFNGLLIFLAGPLVTAGILLMLVHDFVENARKHFTNMKDVVLWRSKANKAKTVLFGDKDTDDED